MRYQRSLSQVFGKRIEQSGIKAQIETLARGGGGMLNLYEEHARELVGMPAEWMAYHFEVIGNLRDEAAQVIQIHGAVAPLKVRGKYRGRPDWRKADKATERTAYFTPAIHQAWLMTWEARTGKCSRCAGDGKVMRSWSKDTGTTYTECSRCMGTGESQGGE
jgi:hypothetical protein